MLLARIDDLLHRDSEAVAISCPVTGDVTRGALAGMSATLRAELQRQGAGEGDRIAILASRSAAYVAAILAVLSLGGIYVPLYRAMPAARLRTVLLDCQPRAVICDAKLATLVQSVTEEAGLPTGLVELGSEQISDVAASNTRYDVAMINEDSESSILYTSGSTGIPKGVMLTHANLEHYVGWARDQFRVTGADKVFSTAPFHFDMSSFDIYVALTSGATLVIASETECLFPKVLLKRMSQEQVTIWKAVPTLLADVARSIDLSKVDLPSLRTLIFSGDRVHFEALRKWMSRFPDVRYFNGYGPTEATGMSSCFEIRDLPGEGGDVPIGTGRYEGEIELFTGDEPVLLPGERGEIVISGPGVAKGYWRDPEKTAERFVSRIGSRQFSGKAYRTGDVGYLNKDRAIIFAGRADRQIKHQGYRIELDDIEVAVLALDGIREAGVVLASGSSYSGLAAYYKTDRDIDESDVRVHLSNCLPAYMVPRRICRVGALPRNDRGKIDYVGLAGAL